MSTLTLGPNNYIHTYLQVRDSLRQWPGLLWPGGLCGQGANRVLVRAMLMLIYTHHPCGVSCLAWLTGN